MLLRRETPGHCRFIIGGAEEQCYPPHRGAVGLHDSAYLSRVHALLLVPSQQRRVQEEVKHQLGAQKLCAPLVVWPDTALQPRYLYVGAALPPLRYLYAMPSNSITSCTAWNDNPHMVCEKNVGSRELQNLGEVPGGGQNVES